MRVENIRNVGAMTIRAIARLSLSLVIGLGLVSPALLQAAAGRDFPRCIHACSEVRKACDERCEAISRRTA